MSKQNPTQKSKPVPPASNAPEIVDPRWLLRMLGILLLLALFCGYLTLGLLFYMGSWQLVLHPTRNAGGGTALPTERLRFSPDAGGTPQLSGEWYAADASSPRKNYALLYLRASDGQLDPADGTQIATLHNLGLNVLAFDYRGYGSSVQRPHPSEDNMLQDATAAFNYLLQTRHIPADHILVFGNGVGVSLAAQLAQTAHPLALIGYNADPEVLDRVLHDPRSKLFPLRLVFHNRFELDALRTLATPKLLYTVGPLNDKRTAVYKSAADPKITVEVPTHAGQEERAALARFLDDTTHTAAPSLLTPEAPPAK